MLKTKYHYYPDDQISKFRGLIHGFLFLPMLFMEQYLFSFCYLISFCYHCAPFLEKEFKFLDQAVITYRILIYPETYFNITYFLIIIMVGVLTDPKHYITMMAVLAVCRIFTYDFITCLPAFLYIISGIIYLRKPNFFWHGQYWSSHDDFHLLAVVADFLHIFV